MNCGRSFVRQWRVARIIHDLVKFQGKNNLSSYTMIELNKMLNAAYDLVKDWSRYASVFKGLTTNMMKIAHHKI